MPTYNYECESCGYNFKRVQSMFDEAINECPKCSGPAQRLISTGAGIIFKGKGFYQTDYKKCESVCANKSDNKKPPACESCPCKG